MLELMIADDNVHFAEHLNYVLTKEKDFKVVNISHNGLDTVMSYNYLKPDVLLLDLDMPGLNGLDVIEKLTDSDKKNIIIITGSPELHSKIEDTQRIQWIFDKTSLRDEKLVSVIKSIEKNSKSNKLELTIDSLFKKLKFEPLSKGTIFLKEAIIIAYNNPNNHIEIDCIMKHVAAKHNCKNYKNVHSTIDKCISSTFNKHTNYAIFREVFPEFDGYKPSTKIFIGYIMDYINNVAHV